MDSRILFRLNQAAEIIARAIELDRMDSLAPLGELSDELRRLAALRDHRPITRAKLAGELQTLGVMLGDMYPRTGLQEVASRLLYLSGRVQDEGVVDDPTTAAR